MRNIEKIRATLAQSRQHVATSAKLTLNADDPVEYHTLVAATLGQATVKFSASRIQKAYDYVQDGIKAGKAIYGLTTSFGGNIKHAIPPAQTQLLQHNLVVSHTTIVGTYLPYEICRAVVLIRLLTLSKGHSGVSVALIKLLSQMVTLGLTPAIQDHGSVGASGDLGPLSALASTLIGRGFMYLPDGKTIVPAKVAWRKFKLQPLTLTSREGLALINGTAVMTAVGTFYAWYLKRLIENSLAISALTLEALQGSKEPFNPRLHEFKPHRYQINTAAVLHRMLKGGKLAKSHAELRQDVEETLRANPGIPYGKIDLQGGSYSLRAIPQIYQPVLALHALFTQSLTTEINAIDDNPVLLPAEKQELHGAHFHGHPIAVMADSVNLAAVTVANIANARLDRLLKSHHSNLPPFLATGAPGLYLGLQGAQYTAVGITAELRNLAHPFSSHQIVSNNDNQDIVSFGLQATLKGLEMTTLIAYVLAVEYIAAAQATWLRLRELGLSETALSPTSQATYQRLLTIYTPRANEDQSFIEPIEKVSDLLLGHDLLAPPLQKILWR